MKRLLASLLLLTLFTPVLAESNVFDGRVAKRRVIVGIRGGVNFNTFGPDIEKVWDSPDLRKKGHTGWNLGLVFDVPILESFYFQAGAFYKTKGFSLFEENHAYRRKIHATVPYIEWPLLFSYRYNIKRGMQVEFNVGPYIACAIGGDVKDIVYSYLLPPNPDDNGSAGFGRGFNPDYIETKSPEVTTYKFCGDNLEDSFGMRRMDYGLSFGAGLTVNRFYFGFQYDMGLTNLRNEVCWVKDVKFRNGSSTILIGFNLFK